MNPQVWRSARPVALLREGRADWYTIRNQADGPAVVSIYDEIGYFGVTAQDFIRDLNAVDGDLELHISSPGGDIFDGVNIYQALCARAGQVGIVVDSLAASIASVIAMAASPGQLTMARNATMMIHDGWAMCVGNAADMTKTAGLLEKTSDNIASIYADRTGRSAAEWRALMREETWFSAQEAVDAGLADQVAPKRQQQDQRAIAAAASWDLSVFAHAPQNLTISDGTDDGMPREVRAYLEAHLPLALEWFALHNADVDHSAWDGPHAMSMAAGSDDPAATYKSICAGRRDGDPSLQKSWALPYKYPGKPPNADGVRNALSQLPKTQGLNNEEEARSTLERLMKQINPDYEGSDNRATVGELEFDPAEFRAAMTLEGAADQ